MIRVAIVAPNPAVRIGLRAMLNGQDDIEVMAEGADLQEPDLGEEMADVLVLASVPARQVAGEVEGWAAVLLLTDDPAEAESMQSLPVPAWGILHSDASAEELTAAVRALGEGLWVGTPGLLREVLRGGPRVQMASGEAPVEALTKRETEVLEQMALGLANKQIAAALGISEHTVKFHLSSLYAKLNVASRTEAVRMGLGLGLISL